MAGVPVNIALRLHLRTDDPGTGGTPAAENGDAWYRTDLGQLHLNDGVGTVPFGPRATHPFIRTTGWHNLPAWGSPNTLVAVLNQAYALPFLPGRECTLTQMAINITLLGLGNVRGGIYNADQNSGLPTTLITDFGTISTGLAGQKTWTGLTNSLRPILYYVVVVQQGVVATYSSRDSWDPIVSETAAVFGQDRNAYNQTGITGALPASFGTPSGTSTSPSIFLQLT